MGGVRTALYNYLYAKQRGGDFIIRIEDTDSQRFVKGAEEYIIESLRWCGIIPDEGVDENGKIVETASERHPHAPYRQSQRKDIYRKYAEQLVESGHAYYAFDTAEELAALRTAAEAKKARQAERDERILAEFNALREKYGRTLLTAEDMAEENKPVEAAEAPEA